MSEPPPCGYGLGPRNVLARDGVLVGELLPRDLEEARHVVEHREEDRHQDGDLGAAVRYDVLGPEREVEEGGERRTRRLMRKCH